VSEATTGDSAVSVETDLTSERNCFVSMSRLRDLDQRTEGCAP